MSDLRLSVVIPTRNHLPLLKRLLNSIAEQSLPPSAYEIIVVDDGSTDGTTAFLSEEARASSLFYVQVDRQGPPRARNIGIGHAHAPIVACLDDDVRLRQDCFERALSYFDDPAVGIVEATVYIEGEGRPLQLYASDQGFVTAAMFFRKDALQNVGGFDPAFFDPETGLFFRDDADIGFRILEAGYEAVQPPDVIAWHPVQFPAMRRSFSHVKRYMFDPLLYRRHPQLFRRYIERKRVGPFSFARPMHYGCLMFVGSLGAAASFFLAENTFGVVASMIVALVSHLVVRYKFERWSALKLWNVGPSLAYAALPFWYLRWFFRGLRRFGGWKSLF